jgi:hypothetical protein
MSERKRSKYDDNYLKFGFTHVRDCSAPNAQDVSCFWILGKISMLPQNYNRIYIQCMFIGETNLSRILNVNVMNWSILKLMWHESWKWKCLWSIIQSEYHTGHCGEAHTIAETAIIPCVEDIVSWVLGDNHSKVFKEVPLSNSTVLRRIEDMSCNTECELIITWIKSSQGFTIQTAEYTELLGFLFCLLGFLFCLLGFLFCLHLRQLHISVKIKLKCLRANLCLLTLQTKIFLIEVTCRSTWLKRALAENNVMIFAQMVHEQWLGNARFHYKFWSHCTRMHEQIVTESFVVKLLL